MHIKMGKNRMGANARLSFHSLTGGYSTIEKYQIFRHILSDVFVMGKKPEEQFSLIPGGRIFFTHLRLENIVKQALFDSMHFTHFCPGFCLFHSFIFLSWCTRPNGRCMGLLHMQVDHTYLLLVAPEFAPIGHLLAPICLSDRAHFFDQKKCLFLGIFFT